MDRSPESPLPLRQISGERTVHSQACSECAFQVQRKLTSTETKLNVKGRAANWILFPTVSKCICKYPPRVHNEEELVSRADSGNTDTPRLTAHLADRRGLGRQRARLAPRPGSQSALAP